MEGVNSLRIVYNLFQDTLIANLISFLLAYLQLIRFLLNNLIHNFGGGVIIFGELVDMFKYEFVYCFYFVFVFVGFVFQEEEEVEEIF